MRVFSSNRGRSARTAKAGDPAQLNARVPEQLLLRFNEAAPHGHRNKLVADALERFLAEHESPAKPRGRTAAAAEVARIDQIASEREAIEAMRDHAAAILEIAAKVVSMRKGPKAALRRARKGKRTA